MQIVGTNGKGSTAVSLATALEAAGETAGAYLSPHVLSYTERMVIRGRHASEPVFAAAMGRALDLADEHGVPASQFELLTAGALALFRDAGLPWAVLEAGLGARHDATTAAGPKAVVLTNVALDHTEYLGGTVEEIAREKLASLAPGASLFLGTDDSRVVGLARERCAEVGAELVEASAGPEAPPAVHPAPYVARNVGLGVRVAEELLGRPFGPEVRERAARAVRELLPGRFEARELDGVPVVVDGGHNPAGVWAALGAVGEAHGGRPLGVVFGVLQDKDARSMLTAVRDAADFLVLTRPAAKRAADPARLRSERGWPEVPVVEDPWEALRACAARMAEVGGVVLVTGSLSMGAAVLRRLRGF